MLKELLKFNDGRKLDVNYPITIKDNRGNIVYCEHYNGYWYKIEYNGYGQETLYEDSDNHIRKTEYNDQGNETLYEDSDGFYRQKVYDKLGNVIHAEYSNSKIRRNKNKPVLTIQEIEERLKSMIKGGR